jgi:hypothetical protein
VNEDSLSPEMVYQSALDAMYRSREDAATTDRALFDAINRELSWALQPIPVSTGLARFWTFGRS